MVDVSSASHSPFKTIDLVQNLWVSKFMFLLVIAHSAAIDILRGVL